MVFGMLWNEKISPPSFSCQCCCIPQTKRQIKLQFFYLTFFLHSLLVEFEAALLLLSIFLILVLVGFGLTCFHSFGLVSLLTF